MEVSVESRRRKRGGGGRCGCLIAGCTVIQEERNVSDKHTSDLVSGRKPEARGVYPLMCVCV